MKTISKRFLKASLAMLLVVMMLFSSTISGFAAVVDNAQTSADVDVADTGAETIYLRYQANMPAANYNASNSLLMTQSANDSNRYYCTLTLSADTSYGYFLKWGSNYYKVSATASSDISVQMYNYGSTNYGNSNHRVTYTPNSSGTYIFTFDTSNNKLVVSPQSETIKLAYDVASGHDSWYNLNNYNEFTYSGDSLYTLDLELKAEKYYMFTQLNLSVYWRGTSTLTTTDPASLYCYGNNNYGDSSDKINFTPSSAGTYRFTWNHADKTISVTQAGYSYTVKAGEGGSVSPTSGTDTSVEITATPSTGYSFDKWTVTGDGSVADATSATTTLTVNADGVVATASFTKNTYEVKFVDHDGTVLDTQTVAYGEAATAPADPTRTGYTFSGWDKSYSSITGATTVTAQYTINQYTVSVAQSGATGTVTLGGTTTASKAFDYNSTVAVTVTAPDGYYIGSITGETIGDEVTTHSFNVTVPANDYEIAVAYVEDTTHELSYTTTSKSLVYGETFTNTLTKNKHCTDAITYTSSASSIASVNASTGEVTGVSAGTATITATCASGATASYTVTVVAPKLTFSNVTIDVNGKATPQFTIENEPVGDYTITYGDSHSTNSNGYFTINETTGEVTGVKPGSALASYTLNYNGTNVIGSSFNVTVNEPTITLTKESVALYPGHSYENSFTSDVTFVSATWTSGNTTTATAVADSTDSSKALFSAVLGTGSTTVTLAVKYNDNYTKEVSIPVSVVEPTITASPSALTLEYGSGSTKNVGTFTVTTNKASVLGSCDLDDTITVESSDESVATAAISGSTVTVTANSIGNATITVSYHGTTKTVPVTVTEYEDGITIYLYTGSSYTSWTSDVRIHIWTSSGDKVSKQPMAFLGTTSDGTRLWAYKVPRDTFPASMMFASDINFTQKTNEPEVAYSDADYLAYYLTGSTSPYTIGTGATVHMPIPTISVSANDISVPVYSTVDVTATHTGTNGIDWAIADETYATVSNNDTTATVTGVKRGNTTLTVCAFASTTGCSLTTLNTSDPAAWPFIGATATVNVNVTRALDDTSAKVYLSDGRLDMNDKPTTGNPSSTFNPVTSVLNTGLTVGADSYSTQDIDGTIYDKERYRIVSTTEATTISFQTVIGGTDAANWEVLNFVVYNFESKNFTILTPSNMGNNTYAASLSVTQDCYIVPVYTRSASYIEAKGCKVIEFYFDATNIDTSVWGPFVACYTYGATGSTKNEYNALWPGQMMVPSVDGSSFYARIAVPSGSEPQGIVFNNYLFSSCPADVYTEFGLSNGNNLQTYDYREGITLFEQEYSVITFKSKKSLDGYHGEHPNNVVSNPVTATDYDDITSQFTFNYLYSRDDVTPMDFYGNPVADTATVKGVNEADYYIVTKGDVDYNTGDYANDPNNFNGNWCVEWFVFDSNGNYITKVLSDEFYYRDGDTKSTNGMPVSTLVSKLATAESKTADNYEGVTIAISYEAPNNYSYSGASHQISYDGQWYGNNPYDTMAANVLVGLEDSTGAFNIENSNVADYGEGWLVDKTGAQVAYEDVTFKDGYVDLVASADGNYKFVGWYTKNADGTYTQISNNYATNKYIKVDTTYYAIFKMLDANEVVINHAKYYNTDSNIPSHGGTAELLVEVFDENNNSISKGSPSTERSTASFTAYAGKEYKVVITTTPQNLDTFFAFYSDSLDEEGNATYEEVFTKGSDVGSNDTVTATFTYKADSGIKKLNIYSDLNKVSVNAILRYEYFNRFDELRVIEKTITLTDDEIKGFDGNKYTPYCPAFVNYYFFNHDDTKYGPYYTEEAAQTAANELSLTDVEFETGNKITENAPNEVVTEAVHQIVKWNVTSTEYLSHGASLVTLKAVQDPKPYTLTYTIGTDTTRIDGYYNDLMQIEAPAYNEDSDPFRYWLDTNFTTDTTDDEIVSYNRYYNYRLVENREIVAVYGVEGYDPWTPVIETVSYTREYQNSESQSSDLVYVDYLLAYHSEEDIKLYDLTNEDVEYGFIMVRNSTYKYDGTGDMVYPLNSDNEELFTEKVTKIAGLTGNKSFTDSSTGIKYLAYQYDLTDDTASTPTNLNRLSYYVSFDNTTDAYRGYTFTTYAYIIIKGAGENGSDVTYLSKPQNVSIWDAATRPVDA